MFVGIEYLQMTNAYIHREGSPKRIVRPCNETKLKIQTPVPLFLFLNFIWIFASELHLDAPGTQLQ